MKSCKCSLLFIFTSAYYIFLTKAKFFMIETDAYDDQLEEKELAFGGEDYQTVATGQERQATWDKVRDNKVWKAGNECQLKPNVHLREKHDYNKAIGICQNKCEDDPTCTGINFKFVRGIRRGPTPSCTLVVCTNKESIEIKAQWEAWNFNRVEEPANCQNVQRTFKNHWNDASRSCGVILTMTAD